jgi:uncharacterized protein
MRFEWDGGKARRNLAKHGLAFEAAASAFGDPLGRIREDPRHSTAEERWVLLGRSRSGRVVVVMFTERDETIRIISARPATHRERRTYEEEL